jgi:hypothetical protein
MSTTTEMIERLNDEADLCRNDGANDIAALLTEAAGVLAKMYARERACNTVNEGEIIALVRMGQELAEAMGLNPLTASPADIVQAAARQARALEDGQRFKCDAAKAIRVKMEQTGAFDTEEFGFAQEMATQYGASHVDDDADIFIITARDLYVMMRTIGYGKAVEA